MEVDVPELPEITVRAREMNETLVGKKIKGIEVTQPKSLNIPVNQFVNALQGAQILEVCVHGKWIFTRTSEGWLLLNLGMGGEILLLTRATLPEKCRLIFDFDDGTCLTINFWWFGYAHYVPTGELDNHAMTSKLGPNALDLGTDELESLLSGRRGKIKTFLLNQKNIAGIGNAYIHDILFMAELHPMQTINALNRTDIEKLSKAIRDGLQPSINKGGAYYEVNLFGEPGGFDMDDILIGYKEGKPCPICETNIEKIKTGSTSSFICPACQKLE
jgi:formamidopyrimidine-DNA glycosylase